jgi:hypothetical protein
MFDASSLNAPIPGMSLTTEPGNRPWENPPQLNTVEEAVEYYTDKLTQPEKIDYLLEALSLEVSVEAIADALTTSSVMNGIHTVDVSILVSPVLYELIKYIAEVHDMQYIESYEEVAKKNKIPKHEITSVVRKIKAQVDTELRLQEEGFEPINRNKNAEPKEEPDMPKGLMARANRVTSARGGM